LVLIDWDTALVAGPTQEPPTMPSPGGSSTPWSSAPTARTAEPALTRW